MSNKRKRIADTLGYIDPYMTFQKLAELVEEAVERQESGDWTDLRLEPRYPYGDESNLVIRGERWETEEEMSARIKRETKERERRAKQKARDEKSKEAHERKLYEKLKKKYDKGAK